MARRKKLPEGADLWIGWTHLSEPFDGLEDPALMDAPMDISSVSISPDMESVLAIVLQERPLLVSSAAKKVPMSKAEILNLLMEVDEAAPLNQRFLVKRRFLEVIEAGNALGKFSIPIPYVPAPVPPAPASPLQHQNVLLMAELRPLLSAFSKSLEYNGLLSPAAWWGRVMLSAMSYGALIRTDCLMALPSALSQAERLVRWLELQLMIPGNDSESSVMHRWFPDPITRMLCIQGLRFGLPDLPTLDRAAYRQVHKLIRAYARELGFDEVLPNGIKAISAGLKIRLHYHLPPWLVSYANDDLPSVSMPEWAWQRLINPPDRYVSTLTKRGATGYGPGPAPDDDSDESEGLTEPLSEWPVQLKELATVIHSGHVDLLGRVQAWRTNAPADRLSSVNLLGEWVAESLLKKGRGRRPKKRRTVYQMLNCIGSRLVGQLGRMDLRKLGNESAYIEIYQNALEDTPSRLMRRQVARSLRSLHEYMIKACDVVPVNESGVFSVSGRGKGRVDANFIALDTFFRALHWIRKEGERELGWRVVRQLELIASLGYFCGLRRSEAIGLTLQDLEYADSALEDDNENPDVWLEVCENDLRGIKTRAGHRTLPLSLLLTAIELKKILSWHKQRLAEGGKPAEALFPDFVIRGHAKDTDPRLDWITKSLQHIADDETLRFHHLRHSFASWQTLLLWLGEQSPELSLPDWFLPTEHDQKRLYVARNIRQGLIGKAPTNRRTPLQVSFLMGHRGLDITMGSYIHMADFILGRMVHRVLPRLSDKQLSAFTGYSVSHLYSLSKGLDWKNSSHAQWGQFFELVADRMASDGKHEKPVNVAKKVDFSSYVPIVAPSGRFKLLLHWARALHQAALPGADLEGVSARQDIEKEVLSSWMGKLSALPNGILALPIMPNTKARGRKYLIDCDLDPSMEKFAKGALEKLVELFNHGDPEIGKKAATQKHVHALIDEFPKIWIPESYLSVRTASLPQAKRWLWFLDHLKLSEAVMISHSKGEGRAVPSAERQLYYWKTGLQVSMIGIRESEAGSTADGTRGYVQTDLDLRKLGENPYGYSKVTVLYGIRFTLGLLWVMGDEILKQRTA